MLESGYATSSLVALLLAVPFCLRMLHGETRSWSQYGVAVYFARLELYLGNGFIGLSVLMLVALTTERYISVCHPVRAHNQTNEGRRARLTLALLPVCTFIIFSPYTLRNSVTACLASDNSTTYRIAENLAFTQSVYYLVYKWTLKILYKIAPTVAVTYLNLQIYWSYRRVCRKRRALVQLSREQRAQQTDEHRLMMLLGSTATLFFFCNLPMVILSVSFTQAMIRSYSFQVFRAVSNVLEIVNYSLTFYIYCLFTKEFRDTFFKTIGPAYKFSENS
ncbi:probable G-protein coupled receptor B0563.6 [Pollicipes pollicipes]|uniref:probable G-protein coupled receptor B0563.6 n=1 Tax=Pollicipes pollicipes TaxID=41117 RepID=UPI001884A0CD|nr:probable G-protein coupled receptor B0563.6 [Pollicipes pollicipes]